MSEFDYISSVEFRQSLEADHAELVACFEAKSWKGVHVLAGSIVEALLIDYLSTLQQFINTQKDALKLDLAEAVSLCRQFNAMSSRAADLCSVVRSYRNLIHPGRLVRLHEAPPDESTARIALELVRIVAREIAGRRTAVVGPTAEQVLTKLKTDSKALSILKHLLPDMAVQQQIRLLDMIPDEYRSADQDVDEYRAGTPQRLAGAFRTVLNAQSADVITRYVDKFAKLLREADGETIELYSRALAAPEDIPRASPQHRDLLREHFLERAKPPLGDTHQVNLFQELIPHIRPEDARKWIDPLIMTFLSGARESSARAEQVITGATLFSTSTAVDAGLEKRIDDWIRRYTNAGDGAKLASLERLKKDFSGVPF